MATMFAEPPTPPLMHSTSANVPISPRKLHEIPSTSSPASPSSSSSNLLTPSSSLTSLLPSSSTSTPKQKKRVSIALPPSTSPDARRMEDNYDFHLFQALVKKRLPLLRTALAADARKSNCKDGDGTPLLHTAVIVSFPEALDLLLNSGASTSILDGSGRTALHTAVIEGQEECFDILIRNGINVNATEGRNQRTALHLAVNLDRLQLAEKLIKAGIAVDVEDINGETALQFACKHQRIPFIELLLKNGANPNAMDIDGMPCLYYCALHGNKDTLQLLIKSGANLDVQDSLGTTPLLRACFAGELDGIRTLVECGADVNVVDAEGVGCIHCVVKSKSMVAFDALWELLPEERKKREPIDDRGRTPLFWAVTQGDPQSFEIAKRLVEYGANVEAQDSNGVSILMAAALKGSLNCVELCTTKGLSDLDETSNAGMTALHFACLGGHLDCTQHLLALGADPTIEDEEGHTPLYCAASGGHLNCVKLLNDHMGTKDPGLEEHGNGSAIGNGNGRGGRFALPKRISLGRVGVTGSGSGSESGDGASSPRTDDKDPPNTLFLGLDGLSGEDLSSESSPRNSNASSYASTTPTSSSSSGYPQMSTPKGMKNDHADIRPQILTSTTIQQQECQCTIL